VHAAVGWRKRQLDQFGERLSEARVGELVAYPAPFGRRGNQTAAAQTGKVVRHVRLGEAELLGQLRRVPGTVEQPNQELAAGLVGKRRADASEGIQINGSCKHDSSGHSPD